MDPLPSFPGDIGYFCPKNSIPHGGLQKKIKQYPWSTVLISKQNINIRGRLYTDQKLHQKIEYSNLLTNLMM